MPGPLPKKPGTTRRRNTKETPAAPKRAAAAATTRRTVTKKPVKPKPPSKPKTPAKPKIPALPARTPTWLKETREYWKTIQTSSVAQEWKDVDQFTVLRLAILFEQVLRGESSVTILREVTALEDRLGLNPMARRKLHFDDGPTPPPDPAGGGGDDGEDDERWQRAAG